MPPSLWTLWRIWFALGLQSFGGGVATLAMIHRAAVDRHRWLTEEEFARDWALVQVAPGINLLALTILIGKRLAGWRGILLCVVGLLLPSVTITLLLTAGYAQIQRLPLMQAALHGIIPATVGIGLVTAAQMARAPLKASRKEGVASYLVAWSLLALSALLSARYPGNVVPILGGAAALGGLTQVWLTQGRGKREEGKGKREEIAHEGREDVAEGKREEIAHEGREDVAEGKREETASEGGEDAVEKKGKGA